jgi:hypothetical protein
MVMRRCEQDRFAVEQLVDLGRYISEKGQTLRLTTPGSGRCCIC